jgi:hypothetical protein
LFVALGSLASKHSRQKHRPVCRFEKAPAETVPRADASLAQPLQFRLGNLLEGRRLAAPPVATGGDASGGGAAAMAVDGEEDNDNEGLPAGKGGASGGDGQELWLAAAQEFGEGAGPAANFMTECYFLAVRAMQARSASCHCTHFNRDLMCTCHDESARGQGGTRTVDLS